MEHQTEDIATVVDSGPQEGTEAEQPEPDSAEGEMEEVVVGEDEEYVTEGDEGIEFEGAEFEETPSEQ